MQDQIRPWLMGLKWTQRCQQKVPENWLLETDFTQLVKKVHLPLWLLVNGCEGLHFLHLENYGARNVLIMATTGPFTSGEDGGVQSTDLAVFKLSPLRPAQAVQPLPKTGIFSEMSLKRYMSSENMISFTQALQKSIICLRNRASLFVTIWSALLLLLCLVIYRLVRLNTLIYARLF